MKPAIPLIIFVCILASCKNSNDMTQSAGINESLENSNRIVYDETEKIYRTMESKSQDPGYDNTMRIWHPLAISVKKVAWK
jgi:hypothetical protein